MRTLTGKQGSRIVNRDLLRVNVTKLKKHKFLFLTNSVSTKDVHSYKRSTHFTRAGASVVSRKLPPVPGTQWEQDTVLVLMGVDAAEGTENKPMNADTECNSR